MGRMNDWDSAPPFVCGRRGQGQQIRTRRAGMLQRLFLLLLRRRGGQGANVGAICDAFA